MTIKRNQRSIHYEDQNRDTSCASVQYTISDAEVHELSEIHYMLDTDICSYIIKNHPPKVRKHFFDVFEHELCYGIENNPYFIKDTDALLSFLGLVKIIPFDSVAAEDYGKIRSYLRQNGTPIGPIDTLIAAHARSTNLILVTNNIRHFSLIPNLLLENWAA